MAVHRAASATAARDTNWKTEAGPWPRRARMTHRAGAASRVAGPERELERGPLTHGWADQRWTLARIKTLIGRLFHVSYAAEGTWRPLKRHGWSRQQPTRRAIERDDHAVEVWRKETWPRVGAPRAERGARIVFGDEAGRSKTPPRARHPVLPPRVGGSRQAGGHQFPPRRSGQHQQAQPLFLPVADALRTLQPIGPGLLPQLQRAE
ncbi:winged helix-turn-helix domain-containing protein [Kitasatospora sp. NPDC057692]|uniref:helix-turn-helix domain-containing protein n=1 Tax=Kitasatospora sp. NPDC057692 TaxID=3346215 RepID=UPI0036CCA348